MENESKKSGFSFSFKAKKETPSVKAKSVICESENVEGAGDRDETDYIKSVDGTTITSVIAKKDPGEAKLMVIPCIRKNNWQGRGEANNNPSESELEPDVAVTDANSTSGGTALSSNIDCDVDVGTDSSSKSVGPKLPSSKQRNPLSNSAERKSVSAQSSNDSDTKLRLAAAEALVAEARLRADEEENPDSDVNKDYAIPLLLQNKVPDGFETDDKIKTDLRPPESTLDDYAQVPIEQFGLALLRGMGWKDGQGIGRHKKHVKPIEPNLRPKGMGLGADKSTVLQDQGQNKKRARKPGDEVKQEELKLAKGAHCMINKGPHRDLYATVEALDEDNCRCVVKLSLSQQLVTVSQFGLKLVDKEEFTKYSRYLNKGKSDRYKEREAEKNSHRSSPSGDRKRKADRDDDYSRSSQPAQKTSSHRSQAAPPRADRRGNWVYANLRVKIVDRKYQRGAYYTSKVVVDDVLPDNIVCRTDSGRLLEGLNESQLETVIPRDGESCVMIVGGKHRSQLGQIVDRNKDKERVTVQLLGDESSLVQLSYDEVCQYMGDASHLL